MINTMKIYWLHAFTPLHVGIGQGVGYIDLPIMREKATGWPIIPGSAIKGVLRDYFTTYGKDEQKKLIDTAFGRADEEAQVARSGSLVFTDCRLICLPIRSLYGTFAWVTCPMVLDRLARDMNSPEKTDLPQFDSDADNMILVPVESSKITDGRVFFEDLDFRSKFDSNTKIWANKLITWLYPQDTKWQEIFLSRFAVVDDDTFNFLCDTATEVNAKIRIDQERKAVKKGALWYEEALPAETILSGLVWCDRAFGDANVEPKELIDKFCSQELKIQIGGKATVGRGRAGCVFSNGDIRNG
jgi:CRISPR-associated protein Cmr4